MGGDSIKKIVDAFFIISSQQTKTRFFLYATHDKKTSFSSNKTIKRQKILLKNKVGQTSNNRSWRTFHEKVRNGRCFNYDEK
jgi:hypothetical protein